MTFDQIVDLIQAAATGLIAVVGGIYIWVIARLKNEQINSKDEIIKLKDEKISKISDLSSDKIYEWAAKNKKAFEAVYQ